MTEEIAEGAEAEVAEVAAEAVEEKPKPLTDVEVLHGAKAAKQALADATANILRLRSELADALIEQAKAQESAQKARRALDKMLEPE